MKTLSVRFSAVTMRRMRFGFCDGAQSLKLPQFQKMMKDLEPYIHLWNLSREKGAAAAAS